MTASTTASRPAHQPGSDLEAADEAAIQALSALAHVHRLEVFKLLVRAGPDGLSAGEIARRIGLAPSKLSFHISQLQTAGLVFQRRHGRTIIYAIDFQAMRFLVGFLIGDCCNGHPEVCGELHLSLAPDDEGNC